MAGTPLYTNIEVREVGPAEVEIRGDIPLDGVERHRAAALRALQSRLILPGFRPGHIPENVLLSHSGETAVFEDMAELAIREIYPRIVTEHTLNPIGKPAVTLTRLAPGNPVGFLIRTALMPTVTLPNYRAIAREVFGKKEDPIEISAQEVANALLQIRQALAAREGKNGRPRESNEGIGPPPELTDELVKKIGSFANVADFTLKLREQITYEKTLRLAEKKRIAVSERIIEQSKIVMPSIIVNGELNSLFARLVSDIERGGNTFLDYLARVGKSEEDIHRDLRPHAEKNAKLQIVLNEIVRTENIQPQENEVERLATIARKREPNADQESVRAHIRMVLANEAVFQFLEKEGSPTSPERKD